MMHVWDTSVAGGSSGSSSPQTADEEASGSRKEASLETAAHSASSSSSPASSRLEGHSGYVRAVALSADGGTIVTGSDDETVRRV